MDSTLAPPPSLSMPRRHRAVRVGYLLLGMVMVALGIIGALLPVMPTTIFMILAAACFGRSSPRFERWLLQHPQFGPPLRLWREQGAMSARAKAFACGGMALGFATFWYFAHPSLLLWSTVAIGMSACAAYLLTRPLPRGIGPVQTHAGSERGIRSVAATVTVLIHAGLFALLLWSRAQAPALPVVEPSERTQLVMLPPRAPEQPLEDIIAPTPSTAASALQQKPEPPRPQPPSPPRTDARWVIPPPQPPQPIQQALAPQQQEASIAAAPPSPPLPPGPSAADPGKDSWEGRVMAKLERHRRYPNAARARREQGIAHVRVSLARDGALLALALEQSSGSTLLDQAALDTFRRAAPLPAVPDERRAPLELSFPVEFFMR
ncbi:TonB family protein [Stenotrophomonas humi]|uniref:TonB family protein n=1 Tax=Stenotrophomonas humi TaxID=405444 RepID=UPI0009FB7429|nr:TonB family protein [Stenotrophomonas humi]